MSDMVEVVIDSIRVSLMSQQRIVILRERNAERYLPIWIGIYEAESITIALQEVEVARPLTHDLIKNVFNELNAHVTQVEVVALRDDTFYGNIVVEAEGRSINIDSRPSDALAIAVRTHVPIMVARSVMDSAGIMPEEDLQESGTGAATSGAASSGGSGRARPKAQPPAGEEPEVEGGEERLEIFSDFLNKLDLEDLDQEEDDDEDDEEK